MKLATHAVHPSARLPTELAPFVGRAALLAELEGVLESGAHLVTLVGTAGVGKSRLARELGRASERFTGEVVWCALAGVGPDGLLAALASAVGLDLPPGEERRRRALHRACIGPHRLLILDAAEGVVAPLTELLVGWLAQPEGLRILVTSRSPLGVAGEIRFAVDPLPPEDAWRLLAERGRRIRRDLVLDADPAEARALVEALDGLPLAIELAAPLLATRSVAELTRRLRDRAMLPATLKTSDPRHVSLETAIRWSWEPLAPADREALVRLAVFCGACSRALAARAIGPGADEALDRLLAASLVRLEPTAEPGLRPYEGVRQFVLGEARASGLLDDAIRAHAETVVDTAEAAAAAVYGPGVTAALAVLGRTTADRLAVCDRALGLDGLDVPEGVVPVALAARALLTFEPRMDVLREMPDLIPRIGLLLDRALPPELRSRLHAFRAELRDPHHGVEESRRDLAQAHALSEPGTLTRAHAARRLSSLLQGADRDIDGAVVAAREAGACARAAGVGWIESRAAYLAAWATSNRADFGATAALAEQSLLLARRAGCVYGQLLPLQLLGQLHSSPLSAASPLVQGAELAQRFGFSLEWNFRYLLALALVEEGSAEAGEQLDRTLALVYREGNDFAALHVRATFAVVAWSLDPAVDATLALEGRLLHEASMERRVYLAFLAAALAERDRMEGADRRLAQVSGATTVVSHAPVDGLCAAVVALGHARAATDPAVARRLRDEAAARIGASGVPEVGLVKCALRIARRSLARTDTLLQTVELRVKADGFRVGDAPEVSLGRRAPLRRLLACLVDAARAGPTPVEVGALFEAGWPGQRIRPTSAAHRVYVAVAELRKLGLGPWLETVEGGYRLDPALTIR